MAPASSNAYEERRTWPLPGQARRIAVTCERIIWPAATSRPSELVLLQQRQQLAVGSLRAAQDRVQQRVGAGEVEDAVRRRLDRGHQVIRMVRERRVDAVEEQLHLAHHHRLGELRLGAELVVDGLPADPDAVGELAHRDRPPAALRGERKPRSASVPATYRLGGGAGSSGGPPWAGGPRAPTPATSAYQAQREGRAGLDRGVHLVAIRLRRVLVEDVMISSSSSSKYSCAIASHIPSPSHSSRSTYDLHGTHPALRSTGTKSTFSRTPQSGQHHDSGTSAQAVPAGQTLVLVAAPRPRRCSRSRGNGRP